MKLLALTFEYLSTKLPKQFNFYPYLRNSALKIFTKSGEKFPFSHHFLKGEGR